MSRILIVEDNVESRYMLEQLLESKGHHVITTENGEDALRLARRDPPEVIISDIMMPVMNGFKLCREVKNDPGLRNVPFIFYTATFVERADEELAMSLGASRFIIKPTKGEQFIQILDEVLDEHQRGTLRVPEGPLKDENTLLEMYDNSIARKLSETVEKLQDERNALIKSELRLKEAQELAHVGHWELDLESNSLEWSDEIYRILGLKPKECDASREAFVAAVNPDDRDYLTRAYKESLAKRAQYDIEFRLSLKDGTVKHVHERFQTIYDDNGMPICSLGTVQDITERKQSEEALYESEQKYRDLANSLPQVVFEADKEGNLTFVNSDGLKAFGYSKDDFDGGLNIFQMIISEDKERAMDNFRSVLNGETLGTLEFTVLRNDGSTFPIVLDVSRIMDENKPVGIRGIVVDITERKQAEEKIKEHSKGLEKIVENRTQELNRALYDTEEARDKIDAILKSVGDGLIVTDIYNRITLMNRAAEDLLGVRLTDMIGRPVDFAIEDKTLRDRIKHTLDKKKEGYEFDFELPAEDGTDHHRTMRARTSIIADKTGKHTGIITIMQDVTHEREVDRMKTEFISTAAHELRTPLTSIRGFSEILLKRDDIKKKEKNKFLTYINDQSVCLSNIINDLLDISRIESKLGFTLNKAPCNIVDIIQNVVSQFKDQSSKHSFDTTLAEKSVELNIDKEKIAQVLQNILSNAVKYSPDGGTIKIKGVSLENHYEVSVEDEGVGMSPDQADKIFEKFFRADASNTAIPGTGLGMSIVKHLVEAHGGEVSVESFKGKGTKVKFIIPMQDSKF
jgi:PAS domain S-box-containing protein